MNRLQKKIKELEKDPTYELFAEAMKAYSKLAKVALKGLELYSSHGQMGTCSIQCPSCRLRKLYWTIRNMSTEIKS